jgi:hypothetical protein
VGSTGRWNVPWGRAFPLMFFFLGVSGRRCELQGHEPLYYFWMLQKQGGWENGAEFVLQVVSNQVSDQVSRNNR